ncbi:hypothetical protein PP175_21195 [Aneurinibacillus sp. Ricciae_BoGa-3]|uniref:hypothetical protein n=1 Tax=Aneurinibacillus sp. Ricciae_BoGa-3 TaxID=3022697 RepID=UPI002340A3E3|nr:hypothetical protein [Aneurinibacillus sp. Ricciae_BoGa-3]WCK53808.1 hypothetical protein PP175_21195 [Aneurinibacillus sp. Ricciae_BoGa-3]
MRRSTKIGLGVLFAVILIIAGAVYWYVNTASGERAIKNFKSNNSGGLERTVRVYGNNGQLIKEYQGKLDIQDTQYGNKVLFDLNGKRVVIYNATVITEEK